MRPDPHAVGNRAKAAIMMMVLGPDLSAKVMHYLDEDQVEQITLEIARLDRITPETRTKVISEFHNLALAQDFIAEGGSEQARRLVEAAFGKSRADDIMDRITHALQVVPFDFLRRADPSQLATFLQEEHPQTIALVLAYLPANVAAMALSNFPGEMRAEIAERIAMMDRTPPDVIHRVERVLQKKFSNIAQSDMGTVGGVKALVDLLNRVDRGTERKILEALNQTNPELASEVMNLMFVFEDIVNLDDRAVQQILREVEVKELALALKGTSPEVQSKIFNNMSERAASMVKEDMEFMGPVKMKNVEEAQQKIVAVIRRLEEAGEISIGRGDEDVLI
ncbi:MAG: Flagellar motor switch protein FliG [Fimbriimonadales bacterium]|nr:MAG: flagellar motor switch protein FliG [Armatimonadota bacterium]MBV6502454.1 Flagellar motor switch protein FliG [Fimbriimonadales bacterium]MCE7898705.1 flagellar motor switch protein FliG [Armatimonadetes bacterium ATM1]MDL1928003.1 flagellar motor switch protein FliG [Fimbriimonadia bacterium ATM]MBC6968457.1 flagellar motor switch protein FliG [Armatimonadota bacterium]